MSATGRPVDVSLVEQGGVLRLLLDEPKGNVLTVAMMGELAAALTAHQGSPELRMVLLRGAGGHFSYGASIHEHRRERAAELLATFHALVRQVASFPVPVAALAEGQCLGAGFELALCCHFVFATPDARFAAPEIQLGVFPPVLAAVGALRLGSFRAENMLLTGERVVGEDALLQGWVAALVGERGEDPEEEVLAWYRRTLGALSPFSLTHATRAVRDGSGLLAALGAPLDEAERRYLHGLLPSHDGNEGIEAFLERRRPVWTYA